MIKKILMNDAIAKTNAITSPHRKKYIADKSKISYANPLINVTTKINQLNPPFRYNLAIFPNKLFIITTTPQIS